MTMSRFIKTYVAIVVALASVSLASKAQDNNQSKSVERIAIEKLEFLVGHWAGEGTSYQADGATSKYYDTEDVWFDVQNSVLIIQARGFRDNKQFYGLHTVIYFDAERGQYVYSPYTSKGVSRPFYCDLHGQKLICFIEDKSYRLTFQRRENGDWNEFGERFVDGVWQKNFETILQPATKVK
ncbi:hypothetical protein [Kordiimonas sp. SCSIO 12610]|uniref:hypothetical protein n=1 Tax=Kordiimonas sp. SCSIO 12610 TaxID=2829597 RepID=UPI00210A7174|nr:hypothetical protein [Kordiimonas sp. SCSIO 12610]UTW53918.1 hypothetical protein KFF44_08665 [Kordiimonas sp. SCSIO 12610]